MNEPFVVANGNRLCGGHGRKPEREAGKKNSARSHWLMTSGGQSCASENDALTDLRWFFKRFSPDIAVPSVKREQDKCQRACASSQRPRCL